MPGKLTRAPELIEFVEAVYPENARNDKIEAQVILLITIDETGSVTDAAVTTSAGFGFDEAAVEAVLAFQFRPAEIDEKPAPVQIKYQYNFTLDMVVDDAAVATKATETGRLVGQILESGTRKPVAGLEVMLKDSAVEPSYTDEEGRFAFDGIPSGIVVVQIIDPEFSDQEDEQDVKAGEETAVTYYLQRDDFEDVVRVVGRRLKKEVVRRTVSIQEVRTIPGTNGDALQIVQNLPGAARTAFGQSDIIFRGGGQSSAFLNSQLIPIPFHFGGLRSTVASALIESIDVYPGNYGVEYGRVNGGIVDIKLRKPASDGYHGYAEADVFDAGALIEGPAGEDASFALAVRRSYIDALLAAAPEFPGFKLTTAPRYYDAQLLYDKRMGDHRLRALAYGSSDRFVSLVERPPEQAPRLGGTVRFLLEWGGGQISLDSILSETLSHEVNLSWLRSGVRVDVGNLAELKFEFDQFLVRDAVKWTPRKWLTLRTGLDFEFSWADIYAYGSGGPPQEGEPRQPGGFQDAQLNDQEYFSPSYAWWSEGQLKLGPLLLIPGIRVERVAYSNVWTIQPRPAMRYDVHDALTLKAGVGIYYEAADLFAQSETFGNPDLKPVRSRQASFGFEYQLSEKLELDVTSFYKTFDDLITPSTDPNERFNNGAIGRAYGAEILFRHNPSRRFFGWVAYTLQRSERRDSTDEPWRLFDVDQTHNVILIGQYKLTMNWTLGARWRYVTGTPTTPISGAVYDADADQFAPLYGLVNSTRNNDFHQLDLRIDRKWVYDTWKLLVYLDVRNVYNRENASGFNYNYDYTQKDTQFEIPIIPSFGVRGEF